MFEIGTIELLVILLVALMLFGTKELGQIAGKLGKGWRDLQKASRDVQSEIKEMIDEDDSHRG